MRIFLTLKIVTHIGLIFTSSDFFGKVKVLSSVVPGRRVGPYISSVVKDDMVLCSSR